MKLRECARFTSASCRRQTAFLKWLLENPQKMQIREGDTAFGTTEAGSAREWRRKLLRGNSDERKEAQAKALAVLDRGKARGSYRKWWAFEGWSQ
jgi:hypothetical protein